MSRISLPKLVLVLFLATLLAVPSAGWSAGRRFSSDSTWTGRSVTTNLMITLWKYVTGLWGKEGCGLDPSGMCKNSEAGCGLDPSGCGSTNSDATTSPNGCGLDPHGNCISSN